MWMPERYLRWQDPGRGRRVALLWPVDVWTVLAPEENRSRLNVFQEGVLGLLHAGVREREELARLLDLTPELVAFILARELQPMGLLDARLRLTQEGVLALKGEAGHEPRLTQQYAFRDALTGSWLPRVSTELPEVLPDRVDEAGRPGFRRNLDSGHVLWPFMLPRPAQDSGAPPDLRQVLQAWRECERDRARAAQDEAGLADLGGEDIELVGEAPVPARVWCEIYVNPDDPQPWLVSDPWGLVPAARWLREALQAQLLRPGLPGLAQRIRSLLPDEGPETETAAQWLLALEHRVELDLADMPHLNRPEQRLLREHMGRVLRQRARLEQQERVHQEELAGLVQSSASLVEATAKWMLQRWPRPDGAAAPAWSSRREAAELLAGLPLAKPLGAYATGVLCGQEARQVALALRRHDRACKALLFGALLCTPWHDDHPLRRPLGAGLHWDRLLALVDQRNKGAHASNERLERDAVLEMAGFAVEWHGQFASCF